MTVYILSDNKLKLENHGKSVSSESFMLTIVQGSWGRWVYITAIYIPILIAVDVLNGNQWVGSFDDIHVFALLLITLLSA